MRLTCEEAKQVKARELNLIKSAQMKSGQSQGWEFVTMCRVKRIRSTVINVTPSSPSFSVGDKLIYSCGNLVFAHRWIKTLATHVQNYHERELVSTPELIPPIVSDTQRNMCNTDTSFPLLNHPVKTQTSSSDFPVCEHANGPIELSLWRPDYSVD